MKKQQGFTLIELVVVIVILGILAVTAAPKFINLQDDAQTATLEGVKAAMQSSSALVHSKSLIDGNNNTAAGTGVDVIIDGSGTKVLIGFGYPVSVTAEWQKILDLSTNEFTYDVSIANTVLIYPAGKVPTTLPTALPTNDVPTAAVNCFAYYVAATAVNTVPTFGTVSCQVP